MSGEMGLNTKGRVVYVRLLDEGTDVVRPTFAVEADDATFVLLAPDDYDPEDEMWEFPPGSRVNCETKRREDEELLIATSLAE